MNPACHLTAPSPIRKALAIALALNTAVFVGEAVAGILANSLSLVVDAAHNFSDELALLCLLLAYTVIARASRGLQQSANFLNSAGLILVSAVILHHAGERLMDPRPIVGWLPVAVGVAAAAGNWGVARALRPWRADNATIRLAYLHNLGDAYVSLLPVLAGALVSVTGRSFFDPLLAAGIAVWLIGSTVQEVSRSSGALLWPEGKETSWNGGDPPKLPNRASVLFDSPTSD